MKPKYKFNLSIILASVVVLCTLTGMGISICRCMELVDYCKNENLSATALDFQKTWSSTPTIGWALLLSVSA